MNIFWFKFFKHTILLNFFFVYFEISATQLLAFNDLNIEEN